MLIVIVIQNRFRANKDRESLIVFKLYANENKEVNEGLKTRFESGDFLSFSFFKENKFLKW